MRADACPTCRYEDVDSNKEPCATCLGYLQVRPCWEPKGENDMSYYCPFHPEQELEYEDKRNSGYCVICKHWYNKWSWKLKWCNNDEE